LFNSIRSDRRSPSESSEPGRAAKANTTSASWLNLVERWFGLITEKQIRRGSFRSTRELEKSIRSYLETYNQDPKPFIWTKTADQILESLKRYCEGINDSLH
jgi:hypothetical protein